MVAKSALERLLGRKLVVASHAGSLRGFLFQDLEPGAKDPRQYSLHVMCSWRIEDPEQAFAESGDWYEPAASYFVIRICLAERQQTIRGC